MNSTLKLTPPPPHQNTNLTPTHLNTNTNNYLTSKAKKPLSDAWLTLGEGSNHSHDPPNRLVRFLTDETVTAPEHRAKINA